MTRKLLALSVLVLVLVAGCGGGRRYAGTTAPSGNNYTEQVRGYLERLASNARREGYNRSVAGPVFGNLANGSRSSHELTVVGGNQYVLFGACDNDCRDVDLKIFDTNGNVLLQDVAVDDTPVLTFTANSSGKYRVEVIMATCNRAPCYYGVQLMAR